MKFHCKRFIPTGVVTLTTFSLLTSLTPAIAATAVQPSSVETQTATQADTLQAAPQQGQKIDGVVAVVNDTPILRSQLAYAVQRAKAQLKASKQTLSDEQLSSQVLNALITRQLQLDMIKRQGLSPDDEQINAALLSIAKQNGATTLAEFQQALDSKQAGSYRALRQQVSEDIAIQALQQQQLARRVKISEQDVDKFLTSPDSQAIAQSQYRTLHVRVPFLGKNSEKEKQQAIAVAKQIAQGLQANNANVATVIEQAQKNYSGQIQGGDMGFHTAKELPTELAKDIMALKMGEVSRPLLTAEGVNVIKLLDKQGEERRLVPQWQTRHILISPSASVTPEMAKQQIDAIYEQLRQGADFATLAATYSNDPGSAGNGGSLGWVNEGEMVAPFEAMMKTTAVNDFSTPFESQFGWHILKVDAKREQDMTDTYRRNMAREALFQRQAPQALQAWLQELRTQSYVKILQ